MNQIRHFAFIAVAVAVLSGCEHNPVVERSKRPVTIPNGSFEEVTGTDPLHEPFDIPLIGVQQKPDKR